MILSHKDESQMENLIKMMSGQPSSTVGFVFKSNLKYLNIMVNQIYKFIK